MNAVETRRLLSPDIFHTAAGQDNTSTTFFAQRTFTILRTLRLRTLVATLALSWQESCENPSVFCYRVGRRIFTRDAA